MLDYWCIIDDHGTLEESNHRLCPSCLAIPLYPHYCPQSRHSQLGPNPTHMTALCVGEHTIIRVDKKHTHILGLLSLQFIGGGCLSTRAEPLTTILHPSVWPPLSSVTGRNTTPLGSPALPSQNCRGPVSFIVIRLLLI